MSARVQSSYKSTKLSKFGAVNDSANLSSSNNNNIVPNHMKSWLQGFDTQTAFQQSQQKHTFADAVSENIYRDRVRTQGINSPQNLEIESQIPINQPPHIKQSMQIGTAIAGYRQKKQLQMFNETNNSFNNQIISQQNPKTAIGTQRGYLNRSIGNIPSAQEGNQSILIENNNNLSNNMSRVSQQNYKLSKLNMSTNLSGYTQESKLLPSVVENLQERDKQILQAKNRHLISDQISRLKTSTQKRRAISLLQGGPTDLLEMKNHNENQHEISIINLDSQQKNNYLTNTTNTYMNQNNSKIDKLLGLDQKKAALLTSANFSTKIVVDHRIIEQWLNDTLQDAEHYKLPGVILKVDHQNPITRYGIDRMTLTNAGIPNDDVNHLYRAMFVYSVGFFNLVKEITEKSKEVYLQSNEGKRHVTKFSIMTAVWKVYQILLEYTYRSDYQLLINKIQEDFKLEREQREREFEQILEEYKKSEYQFQLRIKTIQTELDQMSTDKLREQTQRMRLEEEILKNQKTHEDEVNLRLKFEEKLNNLHALNRITNQNLQSTKQELEHANKMYNETQALNKQLNQELANEKVKSSSFEQKYIYSEDKNNLLTSELTEKTKHNERLLSELSEYIDKYELYNYKYNNCEKELQNEKLRAYKLDVEVNHIKQMFDHYKKSFDDSQAKNKVLSDRLVELNLTYQKCYDELSIYRQVQVGYETSTSQKGDIILQLKSQVKQAEDKQRVLEEALSEIRGKYQLAQHELSTIKVDYEMSAEKVEMINKARNDAEHRLKEKSSKVRQLELKLHDRDEQIVRNHRKIHEMDEKILEIEKVNTSLERDKATQRIEFESFKRQQLDKIHSLEELIKNEKELRQSWCERYERESKTLSAQNLDIMELRTRYSEMESKLKHMQVEIANEKKVCETLARSKREILDTLNSYVVKCEMMEKDIYAMREVGKHFEHMKEKEHQELIIKSQEQSQIIINYEMLEQDLQSRLYAYVETIMEQKSKILRFKVENDMNRKVIQEQKETIQEQSNDIQDLKQKVLKLEDDAMVSRNSYKMMKQKLSIKEDEVYNQQKEIKEIMEKLSQCKTKKKDAKQLRDQYEQELNTLKNQKTQMQQKSVQVGSDLLHKQTCNQEIQCQLITQQNVSQSVLNSTQMNNLNATQKQPKNEYEKYEYHKAEKAKKKKDKREQIIKTSKIQNEINARYELQGQNGGVSKLMKAKNNQISSEAQLQQNSAGKIQQNQLVIEFSNLSPSQNLLSQQHLQQQQNNQQHQPQYSNSSVNVVKHVSDIQRRLSDNLAAIQTQQQQSHLLNINNNNNNTDNNGSNNDNNSTLALQTPLKSRFRHDSHGNVSQFAQNFPQNNQDLIQSPNNEKESNSKSPHTRQRGKSFVVMKHNRQQFLGIQQINNQNDNNNNNVSMFPSTINQIVEGMEEDLDVDSLKDDNDDEDNSSKNNLLQIKTGTNLQKSQFQNQQSPIRGQQHQILKEMEDTQVFVKELIQKELKMGNNTNTNNSRERVAFNNNSMKQSQIQIHSQRTNKNQINKNQQDKRQIKSLLRSAFHER